MESPVAHVFVYNVTKWCPTGTLLGMPAEVNIFENSDIVHFMLGGHSQITLFTLNVIMIDANS